MWFGTSDGLNKYDGYTFKVYRNDPGDVFSISDNEIREIHKDPTGRLWLATGGGDLDSFNPETGRFTSYQLEKDTLYINHYPQGYIQTVSGFKYGGQYVVWAGRHDGLYKLNPLKHKLTYYPLSEKGWPYNFVQTLITDRSGNVWIGLAGNGLCFFDVKTEKFTHYQHDPADPKSLSDNFIWSLCEDPSGSIWIGTEDGLNRLDPKSRQFTRFFCDKADKNGLRSNIIRSLYQDHTGSLWIGTNEGLHRFDKNNGHLIHYYHNPRDPKSISIGYIRAIYEDKSGVLWIGTKTGLDKFVPQKTNFNHFWQDPANPHGLYNISITSVYEASYGGRQFLWLGTENEGIYKIEPETGDIVNYRHEENNPRSLSTNFMAGVALQSRFNGKDELWIYSEHGLNKLDPESGEFTHYFYDPENVNSILTNRVSYILETSDGLLWITSRKGGLQKLDRTTGQFTKIGPGRDITQIIEDKPGWFWVASWSGFIKLNAKTGASKHYKKYPPHKGSICSGQIICLYKSDREGKNVLWIGTNDGLNKFDPESEIFTYYKAKDGLPSEYIKGILEDGQGNLWLSTGNGLSKFNPRTEKFRNYDVNDGLLSNQFNDHACFKSSDGKMYFGSIKGLEIFDPDSLIDNRHIPAIVINNFLLFNKPVEIRKNGIADSVGAYALPGHISTLHEIELSYQENIFSFEFTALDFNNPQKNKYAYKMDNVDPDWVYTDAAHRFASYTNLDPGEYTFRVKGSNNDGLWNEKGTSIKVIILPPWWRTGWAYLIYIIVIVSALYSAWQFQMNRLKMRHQLEMEHMHAAQLEEVDQIKSRFFANISHEFRTPLTLIRGPVRQIISGQFKGNLIQQCRMILRNSDRLLNLINQLLDLSKLDAGKMDLKVAKTDLTVFLGAMVQSFHSLAESRKISFKVKMLREKISGYIDRDKTEKILTNLLSNAFKFTPEGGKIEVNINEGEVVQESKIQNSKSKIIYINVINTGPVIPPDQLEKIFDRFYQADTTYKKDGEGSGIGLALTKELVELHHGIINVACKKLKEQPTESPLDRGEVYRTTFTVSLPIDKDHFNEDEIAEAHLSKTSNTDAFGVEVRNGYPESSIENPASRIPDKKMPPSCRHIGTKSSMIWPQSSILIVEDNPDIISYIQSFLADHYRIITAENGKDGWQKARQKYPDLIISDVMMPEMDGFELCHKLKSDQHTSHIPLILLTARADKKSHIGGLEFGADDYISKPFDADELSVRVKNLINQRRQLREKFSQMIEIKPAEIATSSMDEQFLKRLLEVFEQHVAESDFSTEAFARAVGMSRSSLYRKIQALTNQSVTEFIRSLRLKRAAQLLRGNSATVSEIAFIVGFNSPSYFSKLFRKQFGVNPRDFAAQQEQTG